MNASSPHIDFVEWFAEGWRHPGPTARFFEHFSTRMHPDVILIQPLARTGQGHEAFRSIFRSLFATISDVHVTVTRSVVTPWCAYLELDLRGRVGGLPVRWQATDRFLTDHDGLITERRSYFDPLPVVVALVTRPWAWPRIAVDHLRAHTRPLGVSARTRSDW